MRVVYRQRDRAKMFALVAPCASTSNWPAGSIECARSYRVPVLSSKGRSGNRPIHRIAVACLTTGLRMTARRAEPPDAPAPSGEVAVLVDVQSRLATPLVLNVAGDVPLGEHAQGWLALSAVGRSCSHAGVKTG